MRSSPRLTGKVRAPAYTLTHDLLTEHGGAILCIDERAVGKRHRLHALRPGAELNVPIFRADIVSPDGVTRDVADLVEESPAVIRVDIRGPIEQRAGYHDPCGGWSDGHDAIAERLTAALETADVFLVIDSPGGAHAGLQEAVRLVLREKEIHNRRITVFANEMIGSAAYWWAAVVGDEIYGPESCQVGSIGARAGHQSIAGALEREGIGTTYFAWPGPGKVAFAPELPLSDLGKQRGDRDVALAGESFAAAVGPRRGLTRDEIVDLNADVLSGFSAVRAKLIDGVASLDEVLSYALALAGNGDSMQILNEDPKDPKSPDEVRAEAPEKPGHPEPDGDEPDPDAEGDEPDGDEDPAPKAKYCAACGNKLKAEGDEPAPDAAGDEPDGDEDKPKAPESRAQDRVAAASIAGMFGLTASASVPAVKSAALAFAKLGKRVMSATSTSSPSEALGALQSLIDDAAEVAKLRDDMKTMKRQANARERNDLLTKLAAANLPGYTRGELFVDKAVTGATGETLVSQPAPVYAEMKLSTLRGLVQGKLKTVSEAPKRSANPFEASRAAAESAKGEAHVTHVVETKPGFIRDAASRSTSGEEKIAQSTAALEAAGMI